MNGKMYIGSHKGHPEDGYVGSGVTFNNAVKKYGIENFKRTILYTGEKFREREESILKEVNAASNPMYYNEKNEALGGTFFGEDNGFYGKKHSIESREKISSTLKFKYENNLKATNSEKIKGENNPMYGKSDHTHGWKAYSKSLEGKTYEEIFGSDRAQQLKEKLRQSHLGKKHSLKEVICPHCGKAGSGPNMTRYHFTKCKNLT